MEAEISITNANAMEKIKSIRRKNAQRIVELNTLQRILNNKTKQLRHALRP